MGNRNMKSYIYKKDNEYWLVRVETGKPVKDHFMMSEPFLYDKRLKEFKKSIEEAKEESIHIENQKLAEEIYNKWWSHGDAFQDFIEIREHDVKIEEIYRVNIGNEDKPYWRNIDKEHHEWNIKYMPYRAERIHIYQVAILLPKSKEEECFDPEKIVIAEELKEIFFTKEDLQKAFKAGKQYLENITIAAAFSEEPTEPDFEEWYKHFTLER